MNEAVMVPAPPPPEAANTPLDDPAKLSLAGQMLTRLLHSPEGEADALVVLLAGLKREPGVPDLSDAEIEAEIAAYRAADRR
ncbi:hypothetical protein [Falsiroseomonas ponticola]|uniref:hypothetical protein n=1 Tax=Falsiroseomonas ponticola TaxID=2786951 RepID=UPI001931DF1E|nr:hypothetical protein [Roseomonas ponticola]